MPERRCYFVIDATSSRSQALWDTLIAGCKNKPMILAVRTAATRTNKPHNNISYDRYSISPVRRYLLCEFEIDTVDVPALEMLCDSELARRGITGLAGYLAKFTGLLQAELREAATDAGYGGQANQLSVIVIGFGARHTAIDQAFAWLHDASRIAAWDVAL